MSHHLDGTDVIKHLLDLSTGKAKPVMLTEGICEELDRKFPGCYMSARVCIALKKWERRDVDLVYSKGEVYPIPGGISAYHNYQSRNQNMWDPNDSYGQARLEAARWLAENFDAKYWEEKIF